jgi:uncharacterized protein YqgC (DUF456 family)
MDLSGVDTQLLLWGLASAALIIVGLAGTVLPALPGTFLILAGIVLYAWAEDFRHVGPIALAIVTLLALIAWATDFLAGLIGARRAGASKLAVIGAAIGTFAGIFTGFIGLIFMPLVGAVIGEWIAERDTLRAGRVGIATWLGMLIGTVVKLVLSFLMIGVFLAALLF